MKPIDQNSLDAGNALPAAFINHTSISNVGGIAPVVRIVLAEHYTNSKYYPRFAIVMPYECAMGLRDLLIETLAPATADESTMRM